jgi:16S rRNA G966 N2-methylase RsmD
MLSAEEKQFIREHLTDDVAQLALHADSFSGLKINFPRVLRQIAGRQQTRDKIPSWYFNDDIVYPLRLSLEQSSSETTAQYKTSLLFGNTFVDITGGFGVDTAFIATHFTRVSYVEKQVELAKIARHNFTVLGLSHINVYPIDGIDYLQSINSADWIYIDPSRRSESGKKQMLIEDCEPNLITVQDTLLEKADKILIKLSPMLDINAALKVLKKVSEVHVVSVDNECKELLFLLNKNQSIEPLITCVNFRKNGELQKLSFRISEEKNSAIHYTAEIKKYLYEPNASLMKAGFYKGIALRYCLEKLHPDSHLYTSSELVSDFPGRIFQVESELPTNKKELKKALKDIKKANITLRNFPISTAELRKQLKVKEGGEIFLFATTLTGGKHVILKCKHEDSRK